MSRGSRATRDGNPRDRRRSTRGARRVSGNAILVLIGIELMLNAANLNFIAFWRYSPNPEALHGVMFVIFAIAIAAAEAAVGLALIIAIYRHYKTTNLDEVDSMKG
jgi:NADH-quinone oxidoreductase subunit K